MPRSLSLRDFLIGLAVMAVWGTNFVVIRVALDELPPLLFATLRFTAASLPWLLFVKRPDVPWRSLAAYGMLIGGGQFGLLFIAMDGHITPGLASLVVQVQVFFTIGLFVWRAGEKVHLYQLAALLLGAAGIGIIAGNMDSSVTWLGLALTMAAAASWSGGNIVAREAGKVNMLDFIVWSSLFALPPLFALSFLFEGGPAVFARAGEASLGAWAAVAWQAIGNTLFGYSAWGWLLQRYPAASVSPMALLVPVFGMGASALLLAEPFPLWKIAAAMLVMSGLAVTMLYPRWRAARDA